jgi:hypothetical protein
MTINPDDIELALDDYDAWRISPTLNDYFSAAAYPKATQLARDAALIMMRRAWIAALSRPRHPGRSRRIQPSHARGFVMRQEFHVREIMNTVDDLPVTPLLWNEHWSEAEVEP